MAAILYQPQCIKSHFIKEKHWLKKELLYQVIVRSIDADPASDEFDTHTIMVIRSVAC